MNFSTTKLLALLAIVLALNLPQLSLGCETSEIDCSINGQTRCCNGSATCAMGPASSSCCGYFLGQTAICCQQNGTCLCAYTPSQQCCGTGNDDGFVCGADSICCGSIAAGTAKCCGANQICSATGDCLNPTNSTADPICEPSKNFCGSIQKLNTSSCCDADQTCVSDVAFNSPQCCDRRPTSDSNETVSCCHNNILGCVCTYQPSQKCCGTGNGDGFVCNANDTCCGSIAAGTNRCCPLGTTCSAVDDTCVPVSGTSSSSTDATDPINTEEDIEENSSAQLRFGFFMVTLGLAAAIKTWIL